MPGARRATGQALTIRPATPDDRAGVVRLLASSSPDTLHQRFLTGVGGVPPRGLVDRLLARSASSRAVLALIGGRVVGHGMCALVPHAVGVCADIAILVQDDAQRRGVGSALLTALRAECEQLGVEWVEVTTLAGNRAAIAMLTAQGVTVPPSRDGTDLTYHVPLRRPDVRALPRGAVTARA